MPRRIEPLIPATRDELPRSLFDAVYQPLRRYNPQELEFLASRPQRLVPLPKDVSEAHRRKLSGLAQYRGRSHEGNVASLGNLPRSRKMPDISDAPPMVPDGISPPEPPAVMPKVPVLKTITGRVARRVLSREEWDLYCETWVNWMVAHPEFDNVEDKDDVAQICMETCLMFRLQSLAIAKPNVDISEQYNQSFRRKQQARQNLQARRMDRENRKVGNVQNTFNVSVMSGQITPKMIEERRLKLAKDEEQEMKFLEGTVINAHTVNKDEE